MKKQLFTFMAILSLTIFKGYSERLNDNDGDNTMVALISDFASEGGGSGVLVINQLDSVFFDVAQAVINGASVEFPIYLRSDDVINALDFAFKYDHSHLEYDTIINLTGYIEPLAYYNINDSTVRLTSYSFTQPYSNDSALLIVRFNLLSGQLCAADIDSVSVLLNGDASSHFVSDCTSGIFDSPVVLQLNLYPNPTSDFVSVSLPGKAVIEIIDINAKVVLTVMASETDDEEIINTSTLGAGVYLLKAIGGASVSYGKFVVTR